MGMPYNASMGGVAGKVTAAANTAFYSVIPAEVGKYTRLAAFSSTQGNTANDCNVLRPIGRATSTAAYGTNVAAIVLNTDPSPSGNTIAAGDQVIIRHSADGTYRRYQVNTSGWASNTNTVTFTANLAAAVAIGDKVFNMGIYSDTDPVLGTAFPAFPTTANATNTFTFGPSGVRGAQVGDPLLIHNINATNASVLNWAEYAHTRT